MSLLQKQWQDGYVKKTKKKEEEKKTFIHCFQINKMILLVILFKIIIIIKSWLISDWLYDNMFFIPDHMMKILRKICD